jgi:hypothetical protein
MHRGWKLAIKVQPRVAMVYYSKSVGPHIESEAEVKTSTNEGSNPSAAGNADGGIEGMEHELPVSIKAKETIGEEVDAGESEKEPKSDDDKGGHSESDDEVDHLELRRTV